MMDENKQARPGEKFRVSEALKAELRERTYEELCDELFLLHPENVAEEALVEAYIEIMEEKCPPDDSGFDYDGALAKALEAMDKGPEPPESMDEGSEPPEEKEKGGKKGKTRDPWRIAQQAVAAVAVVAVILGGSYVLGLDWPRYFVEFGRDQMVIRPTESGRMELTDVAAGEYRSLEEALAAYDLSGITPTWIPEDYALEDIIIKEETNHLDIVGVYNADRGTVLVRAIVSPISGIPTQGYENENGKSEKYTVGEVEFNITINYNQVRATWIAEDTNCSINGTLSEQELKAMIHSIFEE